ncbi:MAG: hypothetical protein HGA85_05345 [Nanoarchaeota archaeon]|nr:hypothetical protein [Nanoarchaeota archaeon]
MTKSDSVLQLDTPYRPVNMVQFPEGRVADYFRKEFHPSYLEKFAPGERGAIPFDTVYWPVLNEGHHLIHSFNRPRVRSERYDQMRKDLDGLTALQVYEGVNAVFTYTFGVAPFDASTWDNPFPAARRIFDLLDSEGYGPFVDAFAKYKQVLAKKGRMFTLSSPDEMEELVKEYCGEEDYKKFYPQGADSKKNTNFAAAKKRWNQVSDLFSSIGVPAPILEVLVSTSPEGSHEFPFVFDTYVPEFNDMVATGQVSETTFSRYRSIIDPKK